MNLKMYLIAIIMNIIALMEFSGNAYANHTVNPDGSFGYSIDIQIPPGTKGMQPKLALVYNSNAENGILGMGWQLEGLPAITRDTRYGIYYDGSDEYTGAGGHLVLTGDGYYHYETEAFSRLQAVDTQGDGPSYWIETKADGTKYYYGYEGNSQVQADRVYEPNGQNCVHTWALSRVEDVHGNYYTVEYTVDNGKHYPEKIVYTQGNDVSTYRKVEFEYDDTREDVQTSYALGSGIVTAKRLSAIKTYYDVSDYIVFETGELVKEYAIEYDTSTATASKITAITEKDQDGNSLLNPAIITWNETSNSDIFTEPSYSTIEHLENYTFSYADVNGDRKTDVILHRQAGETVYAHVYLFNGTTYEYTESTVLNDGFSLSYHRAFADINGDGKDDLVIYKLNNQTMYVKIYKSTGTTFEYVTTSYLGGSLSLSYNTSFTDINGDGLTDMILYQQNDQTMIAHVFKSNGTTFEYVTTSYLGGSLSLSYNTSFTDINGDGLIDLILYQQNDQTMVAHVFKSNGTTFEYVTTSYLGGSLSLSYNTSFADINGDGLTDLILHQQNDQTMYVHVFKSNGTTFEDVTTSYLGGGLSLSYNTSFADINSDGLVDILLHQQNDEQLITQLYRSDGSNFDYLTMYYDNMDFDYEFKLAYIDANGESDLLLYNLDTSNTQNIYCRLNKTTQSVVKTIKTPSGSSIAIDYTPALQHEGAVNPTDSTYPTITNKTPRYLTTEVTVGDGRENYYSTSYEYEDGKLYMGRPWERKDLGFKTVTETEDATGIKKVTGYRHDNPVLAGRPDFIEEYAGNGTLMRKTTYAYYDGDGETDTTYSYTDYDGNTAYTQLVKQKSETTENYNTGTLISTTTKNMGNYDNFGNAGTIATTCDDTSVHNTTTTITYENDETNWVLKRPSEIAVSLTGGSLVSKKRFVYTNNNLTTKGEYLDEESRWLDTTYEYDAAGNVTASVGPGGSRKEFTYDSDYNTFLAAATSVSAAGNITKTFTFDAKTGLKLTETGYNGNTERFEYDAFGRTTKRFKTVASEEEPVEEVDYTQDSAGLLNTVRTVHVYDSSGNETSYSKTTTFYDGLNRKYYTSDLLYGPGENTIEQVTEIEYGIYGKESNKTTYITNTTEDSTNECNRRVTLFEYDSAGRPLLVTMPNGKQKSYSYAASNSEYRVTTTYLGTSTTQAFNALNKVVRKVEANGSTVHYAYHPNGELQSMTGPDGLVTAIAYDSLKRKVSLSDPNAGTTLYSYHDSGKLRTLADANGQITTYSYDDLDRVISVDYPAGTNDEMYTYGAPGTGVLNGIGRVITVALVDDLSSGNIFLEKNFSYNESGRPVVKSTTIDSRTYIFNLDYDSSDRLITLTYPDGQPVEQKYAKSGHLNNVTWNGHSIVKYGAFKEGGINNVEEIHNTIYRATGDNIETVITYDPLDHRPTGIVSTHTETETEIENVQYDYNSTTENISVIAETFNDNGTVRNSSQSFTYDSLDRLLTASGTYGSLTYGYSTGGNLIQKGDVTLAYQSNSHKVISDSLGNSYSYDANGNMTGRKGKTLNYDARNRLVSIYDGATVKALYYYDENGHRIKHSRTNSNGDLLVTYNIDGLYEVTEDLSNNRATHHTKFFYGIKNELVAQATAIDSTLMAMHNPLVSQNYYNIATIKGLFMLGFRSFEHRIFKHDAHLKLVKGLTAFVLVTLILLILVNLFLNEKQRFISFNFSSQFSMALLFVVLTVFGLAGCELPFGTIVGDAPWMSTEYAYPDPRPSNGIPEQGMYFFHPDYTGNISYVTDSAGAVVNKLYYKPYGETFNQTGSDVHRHKYNSHQYDGDESSGGSGLLYYNARYYDAAIGRFLTADSEVPDPMRGQSLNRYAYVEGGPIEFSDPSGHSLWSKVRGFIDKTFNTVVNVIYSSTMNHYDIFSTAFSNTYDAIMNSHILHGVAGSIVGGLFGAEGALIGFYGAINSPHMLDDPKFYKWLALTYGKTHLIITAWNLSFTVSSSIPGYDLMFTLGIVLTGLSMCNTIYHGGKFKTSSGGRYMSIKFWDNQDRNITGIEGSAEASGEKNPLMKAWDKLCIHPTAVLHDNWMNTLGNDNPFLLYGTMVASFQIATPIALINPNSYDPEHQI